MDVQKLFHQLFNVDDNTSATIIITLLVFLLGYLANALVKDIEKYKQRKANRIILLKTLQSLIVSLKKRREGAAEQIPHFTMENLSRVAAVRIQFFQMSILQSMGFKTAFESFFYGVENMVIFPKKRRLKSKAFIKLWENMSNIDFWEGEMHRMLEPGLVEINRINELLAKPLELLRIQYTELFYKFPTGVFNDAEKSFIQQLHIIQTKWNEIPKGYQVYISNTFLVKPIKTLCDKYEGLSIARELRNIVMDADYYYGNLEVVVENLHLTFVSYQYSLSYFSRSTKAIIRILD
jgi:hypothetical protein